jgi:hypothetical protein
MYVKEIASLKPLAYGKPNGIKTIAKGKECTSILNSSFTRGGYFWILSLRGLPH